MKKKIFLALATIMFLAIAVVYANSNNTKTAVKTQCAEKCMKSHCTPNCQPGDPNCTCKMGCEKK